jgi:hypothetical protein
MIFKRLKYDEYAHKAIHNIEEKQNDFKTKYDIDNYASWFFEQESETLRLYSDDKEVYRGNPLGA